MRERRALWLPYDGQVITYEYTRKLMYLCGFGMRRERDQLLVFPQGSGRSQYVADTADAPEPIARLNVDEGTFTTVVALGGSQHVNDGWAELCDYVDVLCLIARAIDPEWRVPPSNFGGAGRRQQWAHQHAWAAIKAHVERAKATEGDPEWGFWKRLYLQEGYSVMELPADVP
jgi:hypothetical protein